MLVIVNSSSEVTIDGVMVGNISDAFANHRDAAGAIYDALTAYEQTLRQATTDKQSLLDTANARIVELEAQVTADGQTYEAALQAAQASVDSQLAAAQAAAQAAITTAQGKQTLAESCQAAHWALASILMAKGEGDAAVAAVQEINRLNAAKEKAELLAKVAALPQD